MFPSAVISLVERPERLVAFMERAGRAGLDPEVHFAQRDVAAARGCWRSHREVLAGGGPVLVLEDDAVFCDRFLEQLQGLLAVVPEDWECLWLGGKHMAKPEVLDGCLRVKDVRRSHAYVVRGEVVDHLLDAQPSGLPELCHVDWMWSKVLAPRGRTYAPTEWLVGQAAGRSDISGMELEERWA